MAVIVHLGLLAALAFGVSWHASEPEGVSAELWSAVPQIAAPPAAEPPPVEQPKPQKQAVEETPPPKPVQRDADIAIEKEREKKLKQQQEDERRKEQEKREKEKLLKEKEQAQKDKAEKEQALRKQKEEQALRDKLREEQLKRMMGQVGGTGAPNAAGNAQKDSGPSAGYAGRIKARIKPNIVLTDDVSGNPQAEVEVRCAPDGTILGRKIVKSSGTKEWDEAVLRAIDKTEVLPRDTDGRVPGTIIVSFRPRE
jgi:colicin import membrane protein